MCVLCFFVHAVVGFFRWGCLMRSVRQQLRGTLCVCLPCGKKVAGTGAARAVLVPLRAQRVPSKFLVGCHLHPLHGCMLLADFCTSLHGLAPCSRC
jgi:hypothetical protein